MTQEEIKKAMQESLSAFKSELPTYATSEDLNRGLENMEKKVNGISEFKDQIEEIRKAVEVQGLEIAKNQQEQKEPQKVKTLAEILKDKYNDLKELKDRRISAVKATVQSSDITSDTDAYRISGAGRIAQRMPFLKELFATTSIGGQNSHNVVRYTDQTTDTNSASVFEEAAAVPSASDIEWTEYSLDIENVGDSIKIAQRMIDNVDFVSGEVENFLVKNINLKSDGYLWNGTGSNQPYGVSVRATDYAAGSYASSYKDANLMDLIRVCKTLISTGTWFNANYALLNPVDAEKYLYGRKDDNNNYIIPQNGGLMALVGGLLIVTNNGVTADQMVVGDFTRGVIYNQRGLNIEMGYVDDDFQKNLVTVKGYEEFNLLIRSVDQNAFRHVSSIATAIGGLDSGA